MKALNISGTISESFSIGNGDNKIELRTIDGELYFREFGSPFKKISSLNSANILSPLEWNPNTQYLTGNLFYKESSLWYVNTNFISNEDFLSQSNAYQRLFDFRGQSVLNIDTSNNYQLNILHSNLIIVTGQKPIESRVLLPNKDFLTIGSKYVIYNTSTANIKIYDFNSNFINTILPNYKYTYILNNLSNSGWGVEITESNSLELLGIRKNIAFLNPNETVRVIGASGVFASNEVSMIKFFEASDSTVNGEILYSSGTDTIKIKTFNSLIVKNDTPNKICFFNDNDNLSLKNNTNQIKTIVFHKFF